LVLVSPLCLNSIIEQVGDGNMPEGIRTAALRRSPVHVGDPAAICIADLTAPDDGDPAPVWSSKAPPFWACGRRVWPRLSARPYRHSWRIAGLHAGHGLPHRAVSLAMPITTTLANRVRHNSKETRDV
jgi:hypothetical protein